MRVKASSSNSFLIELIDKIIMNEKAKASVKMYGPMRIDNEKYFSFSIIGGACKADTVADFTKLSDGTIEYGQLGDTKREVI